MDTPITEQRWRAEVPDWRNDDDVSPHPSDVRVSDAEGWQRRVATVHADFYWEEVEARANLIAAAPDLYAALKAMVDYDGSVGPDAVHKAAQAAIAKAEGRTDGR